MHLFVYPSQYMLTCNDEMNFMILYFSVSPAFETSPSYDFQVFVSFLTIKGHHKSQKKVHCKGMAFLKYYVAF